MRLPRLPLFAILAALVPLAASAGPLSIAGCPVFPDNNVWNTPIDSLPVHPMSDVWVETIGADVSLKGDFGSGTFEGTTMGIPITTVPFDQHRIEVVWQDWGEEPATPHESDPGLYAIPPDARIEGGDNADGDRHVLVVEEGSCTLAEIYKAVRLEDGGWAAVGGAKFDLTSNELRIDGWTSADAAGLPILPGLVRFDEVMAGEIAHALRFTVPRTQDAYVWPARHEASDDSDEALPPMGVRFRLKADVDISGFSPANQVILTALKTYGMILADNGSPWFVTGETHDGWNNDDIFELSRLSGADFEAVDVSSLQVGPESAQAGGVVEAAEDSAPGAPAEDGIITGGAGRVPR